MRTKKFIASIASLGLVGASTLPLVFGAVADLKKAVEEGKIPYIVVGEKAKATDVLAAADLAFALAYLRKKPVSVSEATVVLEGGLSVKAEGAAGFFTEYDKPKLFDNITDIKSIFKAGELPILTKDSKVPYEERIEVSGAIVSRFDKINDEKVPTVYLDVPSKVVFNYTVKFGDEGIDPSKLKGKTLKLLGKEYYVYNATKDTLVLLGGGKPITLKKGEEYEFEGHKIKIVDIVSESPTGPYKALLSIDDKVIDSYATSDEVNVDSLKVIVGSIVKSETEGTGYVTLYLGGEKVELNGTDNSVKVNDESIESVKAYFMSSDGKIVKITVEKELTTDEEAKLKSDEYVEISFGFGTPLRIYFKGLVPSLDEIKSRAFKVSLDAYFSKDKEKSKDNRTIVYFGDIELPLVKYGYEYLVLPKDDTVYKINVDKNETYVLFIHPSKPEIFELKKVKFYKDKVVFGDVEIKVGDEKELELLGKDVTIKYIYNDTEITSNTFTAGNVYVKKLTDKLYICGYTVDSTSAICLVISPVVFETADFKIKKDYVELTLDWDESKYSLNLTADDKTYPWVEVSRSGITTTGLTKSLKYEEIESSDVTKGYNVTKETWYTIYESRPSDKDTYYDIETYIPREPSYVYVYLATPDAKLEEVTETVEKKVGEEIDGYKIKEIKVGTVYTVEPIEPKYTVTDKEAASVEGDVFVVVGGPCVNTIAAGLAGDETFPACGAWSGYEGKAVVAKITKEGKEYYVVAGYEWMDTRLAAKVLAYYLEGKTDVLDPEVVSAIEGKDVVWLETGGKTEAGEVTVVSE